MKRAKPTLPPFTLQATREHSQVTIRAITTAPAWQEPDHLAARMDAHRAVPGEIGMIQVFQYGDKKSTAVGKLRVRAELHRGGLGTKLYEAAAEAACREFRQPLSSDYKRSLSAQRFWEKQVKKGRAVCVRPASMGRDDYGAPPERSIAGRGRCAVYRLKKCPAPKTLGRSRR